MADKKYRIRIDTRETSGGGEYYGEKEYTKPGTARGLVTEIVDKAKTEPFVTLDDDCHIRSTDIVAVWVETMRGTVKKVGY